MSTAIECSACKTDLDEDDEIYRLEDEPDIKLCDLCFQLNNLASEYGYDAVRSVLAALEELGSKQSETHGATQLA
jgi:hypothetical protein